MEVSGSHRVPASRATVRAALDDPELLRACIPGCRRLERISAAGFEGEADAKIGPIRANFSGAADREDEAPGRFALVGHAAAGEAGSVKGRAEIALAEDGDGTIVSYQANAEVAGKIAQLGSRLVTGFARKSAETFFDALSAQLAGGYAARVEAPVGVPEPAPLAEAPPLVHEEPVEAPVVEAPPLAFGAAPGPAPIAPTDAPIVPEPESIAASESVEPGSTGASAVTRIMLIAAIVVVVGCLIYYIAWQAPA